MTLRVLLIEDVVDLGTELAETLQRLGAARRPPLEVEVTTASCIEEANASLRDNSSSFDALVVDLMLPPTLDDHRQMRELEAEKRKVVRRMFENTLGSGEDPADLDARARTLDALIGRHVVRDGGFEVLDQWRRELAPPGGDQSLLIATPVLFLSNRGLPEVRARCAALVEADLYDYIERPIPNERVADALFDLVSRHPKRSQP